MKDFERIRKNSRTEIVLVNVNYFEFIAVLNEIRLKVIIKQIENGEKFFWSLIPFWGFDKKSKNRKMYSGNPKED